MEVLEESAYDDLPQGYGGVHPVETEEEEIQKAIESYKKYRDTKFWGYAYRKLEGLVGKEEARKIADGLKEKEPELSGKDLIMSRLSSASPRYGGADYLYWLKKLVSEVGEEQAEADISLVKAPAQKAIRSFLQEFAGETFADTLNNWSDQFTRA